MGKIVVSDNVSLDGVVQDPAGDEGFGRGGWVGLIKDRPGANRLALDDALVAEALLMGRRSYDWMAGRWPSRSGELADRRTSQRHGRRLPEFHPLGGTADPPTAANSQPLATRRR
jgi:dihydrofolate reductase